MFLFPQQFFISVLFRFAFFPAKIAHLLLVYLVIYRVLNELIAMRNTNVNSCPTKHPKIMWSSIPVLKTEYENLTVSSNQSIFDILLSYYR